MQNLNVPFGFLVNMTREATGAKPGDMFPASQCSSRTRLTSLSLASEIGLTGEYPITMWIFVSGFQVHFELPVGTCFLAVQCVEVEVIVVVFREKCARVYLWAFKYLLVDCEVRL